MSQILGTRVRQIREGRRWSLRETADRTGVSKSMLSKIERDAVSPTATLLGRLAEGLGISISQLIGGEEPCGDVMFMPAREQPVFRVPTTGFERRSLSPVAHGNGSVDFVANILPPLQSSGTFPPHHDAVEETLVVAVGRLRLHLGAAQYDIDTNDAIYYRAHLSHRFDNPSESETALFYIMVNNAAVADTS
ncbi:helix-turn-helix domain-containing protein [Pikeienuella piscinae]|uniref:Helix-turn-helix domain-containing protein n=1 Tax=Pikeienuella piscinae TaxID=2748098 RepID=A0A7L5BZG4_9RHOB|nr:XRE family transcriptional regulator [Pikeienuella piscinae]QIE55656.1 helix-turn-helix domain-containing protein [Pikeienuella piscinae]